MHSRIRNSFKAGCAAGSHTVAGGNHRGSWRSAQQERGLPACCAGLPTCALLVLRLPGWAGLQEQWEAEFAKYRASPEYMKVNLRMGLEVSPPASPPPAVPHPPHV